MAFMMSASDFKEVAEFILKQCPGSNLKVSISPTETKLFIETSDKFSELLTITIIEAEKSTFPTVTRTTRLNG